MAEDGGTEASTEASERAMTTGTALAEKSSLRREVDLRDPVAEWLQARCDGGCVADEIDAGAGIADLVATYGRTASQRAKSYRYRHASLTSRNEVELFGFLLIARTESELREWAPWGWKSLRDNALIPLLDRGIVRWSSGKYEIAKKIPDPGARITAVELKLRDWRRAVGQAARYHLFAHEVYVALPIVAAEKAIEAAEELGIGVLGVENTYFVRELRAAMPNQPMDDSSRRLAAERSVAAGWATVKRVGGSSLR